MGQTLIKKEQWKAWIGAIIGVIIATGCVWLLLWILKDIKINDIVIAIKQIGFFNLIMAMICSSACYMFLSLYDWTALSIIKKTVKWRVAMIASFCAYTLSHNLGLSPITSTAARWRIYSSHNIILLDVVRIGLITGIAFWLGIITLGGIILFLFPEWSTKNIIAKENQIWAQITGLALIIINAIYLIAIKKGWKAIGFKEYILPLPKLKTAIYQNALGLIEMTLASAILFFLIPSMNITDYPSVFIAYIIAFISVLITHAPGGIGVLEVTIITMLPEHDKANLIAGLLLFRAIFHLIPFMIGIALIATNPTKNRRKKDQ